MAGLACPMAHHGESRTNTTGSIDPYKQTAFFKKPFVWNYGKHLVFVVYSIGYSDWIRPAGLSGRDLNVFLRVRYQYRLFVFSVIIWWRQKVFGHLKMYEINCIFAKCQNKWHMRTNAAEVFLLFWITCNKLVFWWFLEDVMYEVRFTQVYTGFLSE